MPHNQGPYSQGTFVEQLCDPPSPTFSIAKPTVTADIDYLKYPEHAIKSAGWPTRHTIKSLAKVK